MDTCRSCKYYNELNRSQRRGTCRVDKPLNTGGQATWPVKTHYNSCPDHETRQPWYCPSCDKLTINRHCECGSHMDKRNRWGPRKAVTWGYPDMIVSRVDGKWEITGKG